MHDLFGKNFVRSFIFYFAQIVNPSQEMIKKKASFHWMTIKNNAFNKIKIFITAALALSNPNYYRYFYIYILSLERSLASVLTQNYKEGTKLPISFLSMGLQGS